MDCSFLTSAEFHDRQRRIVIEAALRGRAICKMAESLAEDGGKEKSDGQAMPGEAFNFDHLRACESASPRSRYEARRASWRAPSVSKQTKEEKQPRMEVESGAAVEEGKRQLSEVRRAAGRRGGEAERQGGKREWACGQNALCLRPCVPLLVRAALEELPRSESRPRFLTLALPTITTIQKGGR